MAHHPHAPGRGARCSPPPTCLARSPATVRNARMTWSLACFGRAGRGTHNGGPFCRQVGGMDNSMRRWLHAAVRASGSGVHRSLHCGDGGASRGINWLACWACCSLLATGACSARGYAALGRPTVSVSSHLNLRRYAAAGDRAYELGTEDDRYPAMGFHTRGEMGGIWTPPIKLLD